MYLQRTSTIWAIVATCVAPAPPCLAQARRPLHGRLFTAAAQGDLAAVKSLVARGANVNARDATGETPLMRSAYGVETEIATVLSSPDVARWLLSHGASVNAKDRGGETALILAAKTDGGPQEGEEGATDIAAMLIARGADVKQCDRRGHTALFWARRGRHWAMVRLLRGAGASR